MRILPVGIHYCKSWQYRSRVFVNIGKPIPVGAVRRRAVHNMYIPVRPDPILTTAELLFCFTPKCADRCEFGVKFLISLLSTTWFSSFRLIERLSSPFNQSSSAVVVGRTGKEECDAPAHLLLQL